MVNWNKEMTHTLEFFESLPHAVQVNVTERILVKLVRTGIDEILGGLRVPSNSEVFDAAATLAWLEMRQLLMRESMTSKQAIAEGQPK